MKVGDLVKMKYEAWWSTNLRRRRDYTDACGIVYGIAGKGVKVLMPDNTIKIGIVDHWELIG